MCQAIKTNIMVTVIDNKGSGLIFENTEPSLRDRQRVDKCQIKGPPACFEFRGNGLGSPRRAA